MVFHPVARTSLSRVPAADDGGAERGAVAPGPDAGATASTTRTSSNSATAAGVAIVRSESVETMNPFLRARAARVAARADDTVQEESDELLCGDTITL